MKKFFLCLMAAITTTAYAQINQNVYNVQMTGTPQAAEAALQAAGIVFDGGEMEDDEDGYLIDVDKPEWLGIVWDHVTIQCYDGEVAFLNFEKKLADPKKEKAVEKEANAIAKQYDKEYVGFRWDDRDVDHEDFDLKNIYSDEVTEITLIYYRQNNEEVLTLDYALMKMEYNQLVEK